MALKWPRSIKPYLIWAAPLALAVLWSARDIVHLIGNWRAIRRLERNIEDRRAAKDRLALEFELLEKGDPGAWKDVYRRELHALLPGETEYRFK
ncbi:MAG: hypothetical protein HYT79_08155 [Elusimicrobia bacterium]|nr:hypothetical protein [Elusimicrobiota bacterium]